MTSLASIVASLYYDLKWSEIYWGGVFILGAFLIPELLAHFRVINIMTLSRTSWDEEGRFPILRTILFGFLIGLTFHIVFRTNLIYTEAGAMAFAFITHAIWATIP